MTICERERLAIRRRTRAGRAHLDADEDDERKRKDHRDGRLARKPDESEEEEENG